MKYMERVDMYDSWRCLQEAGMVPVLMEALDRWYPADDRGQRDLVKSTSRWLDTISRGGSLPSNVADAQVMLLKVDKDLRGFVIFKEGGRKRGRGAADTMALGGATPTRKGLTDMVEACGPNGQPLQPWGKLTQDQATSANRLHQASAYLMTLNATPLAHRELPVEFN